MAILQEISEQTLTPGSLATIMLRNIVGWDQMTAFVILKMHHNVELAWEWQRRPIATVTQHPMSDFVSPFSMQFATQQWKKLIQAGQHQHLAANNKLRSHKFKWENVVTPTSKQCRNGDRKVAYLKAFPCSNEGLVRLSRAKGMVSVDPIWQMYIAIHSAFIDPLLPYTPHSLIPYLFESFVNKERGKQNTMILLSIKLWSVYLMMWISILN